MSIAIDPTEDTWNYYSADVTVTRDAGQNSAGISNGATQTTHTVVRTLSGDLWSSVLTFASLPSMGLGTTPSASIDVARMETDDAGNYLNIYARDGSLVPAPAALTSQYPILSPPPGHDPLPTFPAPPPGAMANRFAMTGGSTSGPRIVPAASANVPLAPGAQTNSRGHRVDPRAWIANVIVTPKNRGALIAARARLLGAPVGKVGALDRFVRTANGLTIEELADPTLGIPVEQNVAVNGQLVMHMTRTYVDAGGGRSLLAREHIEGRTPGTTAPIVTDIAYNNVHLETRSTP